MRRWASEWLLLRRDRAAWLTYASFAVACTIAAADSARTFKQDERLLRELRTEEAQRVDALRRAVATPSATSLPSWDDPANPGAVGRGKAATYALLPIGELAVVRGRPGVDAAVSVSSEGGSLDRALGALRQAHVESLGRFALGFLIVVVLPLFVLLLSFDLIARDHESGVARLLLSSELQPRRRYFLRAALRVGPLVAMTWLSIASAAAATGRLAAGATTALLFMLVLLVLIAIFWASVSLTVQSRVRKSIASGIAGLAAWALFVVLVPTLLAIASEAWVPIPSRIARTSTSREAFRRASIEVASTLSRYLEDHPEFATGQAKADDYYVRRVATDAAVRAARAPVEAAFFGARDRRRQLVARLASGSPVSLVAMALDEFAGASDARVDRFRRDVDAFQREFAAFFHEKTMRGERLSVQALQQRPSFTFADQPMTTWPLLAFAAWALAMLTLAANQLPRALSVDDPPRQRKHAAGDVPVEHEVAARN